MAINSVTAPFFAFADTAGKPLEAGFIYIGQPGLEAQSSPKASFFDLGLTIPTGTATGAAVRTSGGYPVRNGSAAVIYVDGDFSVTVKDKNGVLIFSRLNRAIQVGIETTSNGLFGDGNLLGVGIGFGAEPTTGLVRSATNTMQMVAATTPAIQVTNAGITGLLPLTLNTPLAVISGGTGSGVPATGRANLGAAPLPQSAAGVGQWMRVQSASAGASCTLPAGGTWAYFMTVINPTGNIIAYNAGVTAGGTVVYGATASDNANAFCWRIA